MICCKNIVDIEHLFSKTWMKIRFENSKSWLQITINWTYLGSTQVRGKRLKTHKTHKNYELAFIC